MSDRPPDTTALPAWAQWIAQDADGSWWAYECWPNPGDHGWYENEVGRIERIGRGTPPADWQTTLRRRD